MSEIDAEFLAVYVNAGESFLNGDGVFAVTAASGDITINGVSLVNHTHMSGAVGKPDK